MDITQLINTLGFPVACSVVLGIALWKVFLRIVEDSAAREERLNKQVDKFGTSLDSFNATLAVFGTRVDSMESKLDEVESHVAEIKHKI